MLRITGFRTLSVAGLALLVGFVLIPSLRAQQKPVDPRVNRVMPDFTLNDTQGHAVRLYGFAGKPAAVLVFLGVDCPVSNLYLDRLNELAREYQAKDVPFLGINSNAKESAADVKAHAEEHKLSFPVLKDPGGKVAELSMADRTCEAIVLDGRARIRYRGAVDDQYGLGTRKPAPTAHYLKDAIELVLAKKPVAQAVTAVVGCPIDREVPAVNPAATVRVRPAASPIVEALNERARNEGPVEVGQVNYADHVASIIQEKCQGCHRPGQVGPFPLLTFDDAKRRAKGIAEVVEDRRMPPWHADPRFGHFSNDRSLSNRERATLLAWVKQGTPQGDPAREPKPRAFTEGWSIGQPDVVFELPRPVDVPSSGVVDYITLSVPSKFEQDMWIQAAEIVPGVRSVVHHVIVYVQPEAGLLQKRTIEHLVAYVPGDVPTQYPDGIAKKIPAGAKLIFQLHYTPDGTARQDRTKLGLVFAKKPVTRVAHTRPIENKDFKIPPGAASHEVRSSMVVPREIELFSLSPHMHLRGKDFRYTVTFPDGRQETLLSVPAYDFGWQSAYVLASPLRLPKGTRLDCVAHFDNSNSNPYNPDPTQTVTWGEQSFQEMMMGYLDYVEARP